MGKSAGSQHTGGPGAATDGTWQGLANTSHGTRHWDPQGPTPGTLTQHVGQVGGPVQGGVGGNEIAVLVGVPAAEVRVGAQRWGLHTPVGSRGECCQAGWQAGNGRLPNRRHSPGPTCR